MSYARMGGGKRGESAEGFPRTKQYFPGPYIRRERYLFVSNKALNVAMITILVALFALPVNTQTPPSRSRTATAAAPSLLASLPESDAVALVKIKRALDEAIARLLASNPSKLAAANAQLDNFKTRTGIDPRAFDQVALGVRYSYPTERITKLHTVGLARGTFNAAAIVRRWTHCR